MAERGRAIRLTRAVHIAVGVMMLGIAAWMWIAMDAAPSNRWPLVGWPNPQRFASAADTPPDQAAKSAVELVRVQPISADSMAALAYSGARKGDEPLAVAALTLAGQMGWRNAAVQSFWLRASLSVQDWTVASQRIDALMRTAAPAALWQDQLAQLLADPQGMRAMAQQAALNPAWLTDQFSKLNLDQLAPEDLGNRLTLMDTAIKAHVPPDCMALARLTDASIRQGVNHRGLAEQGEGIWIRNCDPGAAIDEYRRNLSTAPKLDDSRSQFTWTGESTGRFGLDQYADNAGGLVLHVSGSSSVQELLAYRRVALPPGRYVLGWSTADAEGKAAPDGVAFKIACLNIRQLATDDVDDDAMGAQSARSGLRFEVPANSCNVQELRLFVKPPASALSNVDLLITKISIKPDHSGNLIAGDRRDRP